jgi:hypothetical protein
VKKSVPLRLESLLTLVLFFVLFKIVPFRVFNVDLFEASPSLSLRVQARVVLLALERRDAG